MIWAFFALMVVGGICGALLDMYAIDERSPSDNEFNYHEGDDDYGE